MKRTITLAALGVLLGFALLLIAVLAIRPATPISKFKSEVVQPKELASEFTLNSTLGKPASLSDYRGKVVLLYFGYTFCPDVCPTTVSDIKRSVEMLGAQADQVQFLMITIDPERDTPQKFGEYLRYFNPGFVGFTPRPDELARVATQYAARYYKHEGTAATGYLLDHSPWVAVIDREGYLVLRIPFGLKPQDIVSDLKILLSQ